MNYALEKCGTELLIMVIQEGRQYWQQKIIAVAWPKELTK
jgi:hypothetical protein